MSEGPWTKDEAEAIEKAAAQVPSAADMQAKERDRQSAEVAKVRDWQNRMFCVQEATKACAAGGYEPAEILRVVSGFYGFLTGQSVPTVVADPPKMPLRKA